MRLQHRGGGSEVTLSVLPSVCRCCCHGNNRWNAPSESWVDLRSGPDLLGALENSVSDDSVKLHSSLSIFLLFFLPTLTSTDSQLTLWHPYPRAFHLKLESSCPWIILSWDSPRIPRTELSWGRCREEEWSWEPFWGSGVHKCLFWTVSVAWEAWMLVSLCLYMNLTEWGHCTQPHLSIQLVKVRIRVWFKSRVRPQGIDGINKSVWLCSSFCVLTCVHIVTEW